MAKKTSNKKEAGRKPVAGKLSWERDEKKTKKTTAKTASKTKLVAKTKAVKTVKTPKITKSPKLKKKIEAKPTAKAAGRTMSGGRIADKKIKKPEKPIFKIAVHKKKRSAQIKPDFAGEESFALDDKTSIKEEFVDLDLNLDDEASVQAEEAVEAEEAERQAEEELLRQEELAYQRSVAEDERIRRDKTLIIWSGVIFFSLLIFVFWVLNIRTVFKEPPLDRNASFKNDWGQISDDLKQNIKVFKEGMEEVRNMNKQAESSADTDVKNGEVSRQEFGQLQNQLKNLEQNMGSSTAGLDRVRN